MKKKRCPKCGIDLSNENYSSIKIRDENLLALRLLSGKVSLENDIEKKRYCDLCEASINDILVDKM